MFRVILVTGAAGMIGTGLVKELVESGKHVIGLDCKASSFKSDSYVHIIADLLDKECVEGIFASYDIERVIHLAALAHTAGIKNLSYNTYYEINVSGAENIFSCAGKIDIPVLFTSTVDVYGFVKGVATEQTVPKPVTDYGKTKYLAERSLKQLCDYYDIFRFAPVYSDDVKRDIQKRYYLKYPNWAYRIGKGMDCEFLYIDTAIKYMIDWCQKDPTNKVFNIKDSDVINTADCILEERSRDRAKHVVRFPSWITKCGFHVIYCLTGKNKYTYLLNKAVYPLRTE